MAKKYGKNKWRLDTEKGVVMECITEKQRKMIFALVGCYSRTVYQSIDSYFINKSLDEIKSLYVESVLSKDKGLSDNIDDRIQSYMRKMISIKSDDLPKALKSFIRREIQIYLLEEKKSFSISNRMFSQKAATQFIDWLIGYFVENEIELSDELIKKLDDKEKEKFIYACLVNNKCVVCGRHTKTIHHITRVGTTGYKNDTGVGKVITSLCQYHHGEVESIGEKSMKSKYFNYSGIVADEKLISILKKKYPKFYFEAFKESENEINKS